MPKRVEHPTPYIGPDLADRQGSFRFDQSRGARSPHVRRRVDATLQNQPDQLDLFDLPRMRADLLTVIAGHANDENLPIPDAVDEAETVIPQQELCFSKAICEDAFLLDELQAVAAPYVNGHTIKPRQLSTLSAALARYSHGELAIIETAPNQLMVVQLLQINLPYGTDAIDLSKVKTALRDSLQIHGDFMRLLPGNEDKLRHVLNELYPGRFRVFVMGNQLQIIDKEMDDPVR